MEEKEKEEKMGRVRGALVRFPDMSLGTDKWVGEPDKVRVDCSQSSSILCLRNLADKQIETKRNTK